MVKVSIVVPVCNVEKYLKECIDSLINQTLKDIEIICIDDGSTDSSGQILDEYANKDSRVKVLHKSNTGYGNSMNIGFSMANGEYIGIVESDDFASENMFEALYEKAKENDLDVIKGNYYVHKGDFIEDTVFTVFNGVPYNEIITPLDERKIFRSKPCIWAAMYRRQFIVENHIKFTETKGASFQDTAFCFKVWINAKRVMLVEDAFLHYRVDNVGSSVKQNSKIFCVCDEYKSIEAFLMENVELNTDLKQLETALKFEGYRWNLDRLDKAGQEIFLPYFVAEFRKEQELGNINRVYYSDANWNRLQGILNYSIGREEILADAYIEQGRNEIRRTKSYKLGNIILRGPILLKRLITGRKNNE